MNEKEKKEMEKEEQRETPAIERETDENAVASEECRPGETETERLLSEVASLKDQLLRERADFENARKRLEKQKHEDAKYASRNLIRELLTVMDNLELALSYAAADDPLREGVSMALDGMKKILKHHHVSEIKPLGETFNPALHEALSTRNDPAAGENEVVEVHRVGYMLHDRVIRPASVVVNHQPPSSAEKN